LELSQSADLLCSPRPAAESLKKWAGHRPLGQGLPGLFEGERGLILDLGERLLPERQLLALAAPGLAVEAFGLAAAAVHNLLDLQRVDALGSEQLL